MKRKKKNRLGLIESVHDHYENMSVQHEAIPKSGKNDILDVKM